MRSITVKLEDTEFSRLEAEAARRGRPLEEQAAVLIGEALRGPSGRALAVLDALEARQEPLSDTEAARLAEAEIRAMRAERRASGRR